MGAEALESRFGGCGFGGSGFRVQGSESRVGGNKNKKPEYTLSSLPGPQKYVK